MKLFKLIAVALVSLGSTAAFAGWTTYEAGMAEAVKTKKPVLVNVCSVNASAAGNEFNTKLGSAEFNSYSNGRMILVNVIVSGAKGWEKSQGASLLKSRAIAQQLGATSVPTVLVLDSTGRKLGQLSSSGTIDDFLKRLDDVTKLGMVAYSGPTPPPSLNISHP